MSRNVLVIGGGGREHALVRQLAASPRKPRLFAAPGNPGTGQLARNLALDPLDFDAVVAACSKHAIDLVVIGPEEPLIAGLADHLRHAGYDVFGPGRLGARLEGDKEYAKEVMAAAGVPTAHYQAVSTLDTALNHLETLSLPVVVKACGAAQGKGVAVCATQAEAEAHLRACLVEQRFGDSGERVLLEECLFGPELSVLIVTDGQDYALLAPSRDHKRVGDGGTGPNTGGMGAYAPVALDAATAIRIDAEIVTPVLAELNRRDIPYRGVLYAGLMLTDDGPKVLEFNTRFGDPEAQVVLPLIQGDFLELLHATARGALGGYLQGLPDAEVPGPATWPGHGMTDWTRHCVVVVGTSEGYPNRYTAGVPLVVPPDAPDRWVIQAGTALRDGQLVTAGGRVIGAVAEAHSLAAARRAAYEHLALVEGDGLYWRRDIAQA